MKIKLEDMNGEFIRNMTNEQKTEFFRQFRRGRVRSNEEIDLPDSPTKNDD